jgi:putative hemolysin
MDYIFLHLILLIILLIFSAFFSCAETALFSLKKADLHRFSESKKNRERSIARIMNEPDKIMITLVLGNLFVNLSLTSIATSFMLNFFGHYGHIITMAFLTPMIIIFSEITPKIIAVNSHISISIMLFPLINLIDKIIFPIRFFIIKFTNLFIKLLNLNLQHSNLTEDELGHVISTGEKQGVIDRQESHIIKNVLRFKKKEASNVMYPRNQAVFIQYGSTVEETAALIIENEIIRIPVYKNDPDNIVGVIDSRDIISTYLGNKKKTINKFIKPVDFFPFSKDLNELLNDFLKKKIQIAVIVDEYGGTAGIVTLNSILSALLGKDFGMWENSRKVQVRTINDKNFIVSGEMQLDEFNFYFNLNLYSSNSDTIGGYVIEKLSSIPHKGDYITIENLKLTIKNMIKSTIRQIEVEKINTGEKE